MGKLPKLFEPIKIGNIELKNRMKLSPIATGFAGSDCRVTESLKAFYKERAAGGIAFIGITALPLPGIISGCPSVYDDKFIPELAELVRDVHANGAKIYAQFGVGYGWRKDPQTPFEFVSPSGIFSRSDMITPRELSCEDIHRLIEDFGEASRRARDAGFDAVDLIFGTGYILSQFLSPLTNKRTDEYGGSFENRVRLLLEIIDNIKKKAGNDYTLICRISGQIKKGGYTIEELKDLARLLERAGIQSIDVLPGWHEDPVEMVLMSTPQGAWVDMAEEIKKAVTIPVGAGTKISDPVVAERVLQEGRADYVYMCRAIIADPEFPNKVKQGRLGDIRPCIGCCYCFEKVFGSNFSIGKEPIRCAVNARVGMEGEYIVEPATVPQNILVIGGGPAGMEAARIAAQKGHHVTLCEKKDRLGGNLIPAAVPPTKGAIGKLISYYIEQMNKLGVICKLGEKDPLRLILEDLPDEVIAATGALPMVPDIPGAIGGNVVTAIEVLTGGAKVGEKVVVVGGGLIGCETALFLAENGKMATIIEMLEKIGLDIDIFHRWAFLERLRKAGVRMEKKVKVTDISDQGVSGIRNGSIEFFPGETVVLAVGMRSDQEVIEKLKNSGIMSNVIGDCLEPRRIRNAVEEGFKVAIRL
jgi:2,4-dienoyl-CoA reductase-like NADH-dependent reductase (Old Yellow Enzyme family)/thioredoxin reductase